MKKYTHYALTALLMTLLFACKKENTTVITPISSDLTIIYQGTFTASAHATTGSVKLSKDAAGKKYLIFEGFKTDAGPDLRVYLSEDLKATSYVEIASKVSDGTYQLDVTATVDTDKKRKVLIWCKAFGVLFGSADLK
jgi:molybdopterin-guanine dinucleotide biosynthesis protein